MVQIITVPIVVRIDSSTAQATIRPEPPSRLVITYADITSHTKVIDSIGVDLGQLEFNGRRPTGWHVAYASADASLQVIEYDFDS